MPTCKIAAPRKTLPGFCSGTASYNSGSVRDRAPHKG